jgi:hypothetical protein
MAWFMGFNFQTTENKAYNVNIQTLIFQPYNIKLDLLHFVKKSEPRQICSEF